MGIVFLDITMSLDGFVTGPNVGADHPLGEQGERLHDWLFQGDSGNAIDKEVAAEFFTNTGAFIIGRRTFDLGEEPWGDDGAFGVPCFVVTHRPREVLVKGPTTFTFITDGFDSALAQAKAAAGDKDVCVMGGAQAIQHYLNAGQADELRLHIANWVMGAGTLLFEGIDPDKVKLEKTRLLDSPYATHLRFRLVK